VIDRPALGPAATEARADLSALIESGVFPPGRKLPSERELAERLSVSRVVLRSALASLAAEERVHNSPRRGWFATAPRMAEQTPLRSFSELARSRGLAPGAHVVMRQTRAASLAESKKLGIAPASTVHEVHRVRSLDGIATCFDVSILPVSRHAGIESVNLENVSLYEVLETLNSPRVVRSDYRIRADAASAEVATALGVMSGAPVLVGEETASDLTGSPVLFGRVTYRHDAYEFQATLWRTYERPTA
jgi:GntR family transcriptional regulator